MIEKMRFLSITGPKCDIDRVIEKYLSKYEIHLENALSELKNVKGLHTFTQSNPYKSALDSSETLKLRLNPPKSEEIEYMDFSKAADFINNFTDELKELSDERDRKVDKITGYKDRLSKVQQFKGLNYDVSNILHFKFIKFRFGRIEKE